MKHCFMPNCVNNDENTNKYFVTVPVDAKTRKLWWQAAGFPLGSLQIKSKRLHCCQDHFKIPDDFENWEYAKFAGIRPVIKRGILPHANISPTESAGAECGYKRKNEDDEENKRKEIKLCVPSTSNTLSPVKIKEISQEDRNLMPSPGSWTVSRSSSTSTLTGSPVQEVISPRKVGSSVRSPDTTLSSQTSSTCSSGGEFVPTSTASSGSEELSFTTGDRLKTTTIIIERHSRFYLGLPKDVYCLLTIICEKVNVIHRDVLITLKKIRLDDTYFRLHVDFELSVSQVQKVFVKTVPLISEVMNNFIFWPSADKIQDVLPLTFRARYAKVQSIIDCFEVQIEKPSHPVLQSNTWSDYKQCNTVKFLISCTPNGFINFISQAYPGRISDKHIVAKSGYLTKVPMDAHILADRGFKHVQNILLQKNCTLIRPASVSGNEQSSSKDVRESKQIASLRIHIERIINRVRDFEMLSPHACTNNNFLPFMTHFVIIACGVINFQESIM